jgi:hypothetical protein
VCDPDADEAYEVDADLTAQQLHAMRVRDARASATRRTVALIDNDEMAPELR